MTITSVKSGVWSDPTVWGEASSALPPGYNDIAVINHQIILDGNYQVGGISPTSVGCLIQEQSPQGLPISYVLQVGNPPLVFIAKGLSPIA